MTFKDFVGGGSTGIIGFINLVVVPFIFTIAFAAFLWGIFNYFFFHGEEGAKRAAGREFILYGIIGMVVLFSVWGLVNILLATLGILP